MEYNEQKQERVILAGVHRGMRDVLWDTTEESISEIEDDSIESSETEKEKKE